MQKTNNIFYVYVHRRLTDNKPFYVGKGKGNRAFTSNGRNDYWKNTKDKHGFSVEIVFENLTEDEAFQCEKDTITEFRYFGYPLTNLTDGGEGVSGIKQSAETIRKRVLKNTGKKRTEETKLLLSNSLKGKIVSEETRKKISEASRGRIRDASAVEKTAKSNTGKKRSTETKVLMSILAKERSVAQNLSEKMSGSNNPCASNLIHKFLNIVNGEIFVGTRVELCTKFNINANTLRNLFGNKRKSAANWTLLKE